MHEMIEYSVIVIPCEGQGRLTLAITITNTHLILEPIKAHSPVVPYFDTD